MKGYYSKIRELEKELERSQKIYSKLCRQRENLNDSEGRCYVYRVYGLSDTINIGIYNY